MEWTQAEQVESAYRNLHPLAVKRAANDP